LRRHDPYFAGRSETLWAQLGSRSADASEADVLKRLAKKPIEYLKMFYGDTVLGGSAADSNPTSGAQSSACIFKLLEVSRHKSIETLRAYVKWADQQQSLAE
jgi:hypothetical protein